MEPVNQSGRVHEGLAQFPGRSEPARVPSSQHARRGVSALVPGKVFFGRFGLFSRYDSRSRIILYPWVNDERSLPQRDGKSDPYEMIRRMLASDNPPNEWGRWLDVPKSCQVKFCRPWRTV